MKDKSKVRLKKKMGTKQQTKKGQKRIGKKDSRQKE